jgi:hypothetical protein
MCVCMYVCTMHGCACSYDVYVYVQTTAHMYVCMHACMYICMYAWRSANFQASPESKYLRYCIMYVCMYVCMYVWCMVVHVRMMSACMYRPHKQVYTYLCKTVCMYVCLYICMYTYVRMCECIYTMQACMYACTHVYIYIYIYIHIYIYIINANVHIHIHSHILTK